MAARRSRSNDNLESQIKTLKHGFQLLHNHISFVDAKCDSLTQEVSKINKNVFKIRGLIDLVSIELNKHKSNDFNKFILDTNGHNPLHISFQSTFFFCIINMRLQVMTELNMKNIKRKAINIVIGLYEVGFFNQLKIKKSSDSNGQCCFEVFMILNVSKYGGDKIEQIGICDTLRDKDTHFNVKEMYNKYIMNSKERDTEKYLNGLVFKQGQETWKWFNGHSDTNDSYSFALFIVTKGVEMRQLKYSKFKQLKKGKPMELKNIITQRQPQRPQQPQRRDSRERIERRYDGRDRSMRYSPSSTHCRSRDGRYDGYDGRDRSMRCSPSSRSSRHCQSRDGAYDGHGGYGGYHDGYHDRPSYHCDFIEDASVGI